MKQRKGFDSMRTKTLQTVAVTLGLSVCTIAQADSPYSVPSKWNNFRTVSDTIETVPTPAAELPVPSHTYAQPQPAFSAPAAAPVGTGCAPSESSPYSQALSSPWVGSTGSSYGAASGGGACGGGAYGTAARPALSPWFGSANLLFFTRANGRGRSILSADIQGGIIRSSLVRPRSSLGFDVGFGRYFGCGQYGLGLNYMNWNPGQEQVVITNDFAGNPIAAGGGLRSDNIFYNDVSIDPDGAGANAAETVYNTIDGVGGPDPVSNYGAQGIRLTRDMSFQGIEANLYSFGLLGARRAAYAGCAPGFGGAAGPMIRPSSGRLRVMTSHGFRWFQVNDDFEAAFNIDGAAGYQAGDLYDNVEIENNLFGYQFGSMLNYCLSSRLNANIGSKFGIYGNNVDYRHRLGTETALAYTNFDGAGAGDINVSASDTVLAAMGEFDMGLGYRISNAWSIRGGYRLMAISGVADSVENQMNADYSSIARVSDFDASSSLILHGAYVGMAYNW